MPVGPKSIKCDFCKLNFPTKSKPVTSGTLKAHLRNFHCRSVDLYDFDTRAKLGTCTRPEPMADLSCFIEGCDVQTKTSRKMEVHFTKLHNGGAKISSSLHPPTMPGPTKSTRPAAKSAKHRRKTVAKPAPPAAKEKGSSPAPTGIERLQALYSDKPTELEEEEERTSDGDGDEKPYSDDERNDDERAEVNLDEPAYRNSTRLRSLTHRLDKTKLPGEHASGVSVSLAEEVHNLFSMLANKLDNIHSDFGRQTAETERQNTLLTQLLSVLARDGMSNNSIETSFAVPTSVLSDS